MWTGGSVVVNKHPWPGAGDDNVRTLAGVGVGLVYAPSNAFSARIEYAVPVGSNGHLAGGLVGEFLSGITQGYGIAGSIEQSYAISTVVGAGQYVGGLVGRNQGAEVLESFAIGSVEGEKEVGGLVGANTLDGTIKQSYAISAVNGDDFVGGAGGVERQPD